MSILATAPVDTAAVNPADRPDVLTLSCPQRPGIVSAVTTFLVERGLDIVEHQQFDDRVKQTLFLRTAVSGRGDTPIETLRQEFAPIAAAYDMQFGLHDATPQRLLIMVSKLGHCLNDLIFRWNAGSLGAQIVAVVSNHDDLRPMAEAAGLPYVRVPVTKDNKPEAEARLEELVEEHGADVVVLARYMQVLSDGLVDPAHRSGDQHPPLLLAWLQGRSPLPSGVRPRRQDGRSDRALRDARARRGPDHRAGGDPGRPQL